MQDFTIWSGDHFDLNFIVTVASTGAGVNLTGASVTWVLSNDPNSPSLVRLSTACGIAVSGSLFTVSGSPAQTANLAGLYYHEAQVIDTAGNVSTVAVGTAKINYDVAGQ